MKSPQVLYHPGNCLNNKKPYPKECRLCLQYCPHDAISDKKEIDKEKCTECGVCMAVCPSDGLVDRDIDQLGEYLFYSKNPIMNCPSAQPEGYEIPCIGLFDRDAWITMLVMAAEKDIRIITGDCGACDDRLACAASVAVFKEILPSWNKPINLRIEVVPYDETKEEQDQITHPNSKFNGPKKSIREQGKNKIKSLLPGIEAEETYPIPKTRQWLEKALEQNETLKIPFKTVKAGDQCTSCGVCAKICPQHALSQKQKEGKARLIYEPLKCIQCGRCVDICGPSNLHFGIVDLSYRFLNGKVLLSESVPRHCEKCGKQIFHNKEPRLCMPCAAKDPNLKGVLY